MKANGLNSTSNVAIKRQATKAEWIKYLSRFWKSESGEYTIDVEKLYKYLIEKGCRYIRDVDDHKWLAFRTNNKIVVCHGGRLWTYVGSRLDIEPEFKSLSDDVRSKIKEAIKKFWKELKKSKLTLITKEEIEKCDDSGLKKFALSLLTISYSKKGVAE